MTSFTPITPQQSAEKKIASIHQQITQAAERPLNQAVTLPATAYTDPDYYDWEVEQVLKRDWLCVAHVSQIPQVGDYLCLDLLEEPIIVLRGKDQQVRVLSRVCPHRGMDILPPPPAPGSGACAGAEPTVNPEPTPGRSQAGNRRILVCPYHTWTFELDGRLRGCPEMQQAEGFCKDDWGLANIKTEVWNGFVFVNLSGDASDLAPRMAHLNQVVADWDIASLKVAIEDEWDCAFNWKTLVENWIESYHHVGAHAKTLQPMMPAKNTWTEPQRPHEIYCHLPFNEEIVDNIKQADAQGHEPIPEGLWNIPGVPLDKRQEWHLFVGLPMFLFLCDRDRVIWYRIQPTGPNSIRLLTTTLVHPDNLKRSDWQQVHDRERTAARTFHLEDMEMLVGIERGLKSKHYVQGRLSHLEEPVWLIQRFLAARIAGDFPAKMQKTGPQLDGWR